MLSQSLLAVPGCSQGALSTRQLMGEAPRPSQRAQSHEGWQGERGQLVHLGKAEAWDQKRMNWEPSVGREPGQIEAG